MLYETFPTEFQYKSVCPRMRIISLNTVNKKANQTVKLKYKIPLSLTWNKT